MVEGSGISGRSVVAVIRSALLTSSRPSEARAGTHNHVWSCCDRLERQLNPQLALVAMGPCFRRDDSSRIFYTRTAVFGQYLSRKCRFTSLPVGVRGSSASKSMLFGHLIGDKCLRQNNISSASNA